VTVTDGRTTAIEFRLTAAAVVLGAVEVLGELSQGQAKALQQQQSAANIKSVVAAEQIQRFPDRNAAEAVQRLPGVTMTRSEGEGEEVQVRALGISMTAMTVNGQRVPSYGPGRGDKVEVLPTNVVKQITVTKAVTPEMDGDAVGGVVDFQLAEAPQQPLVSFRLQGGIENNPSFTNNFRRDMRGGALTLGRRFGAGRAGLLLSGTYNERQNSFIEES